MRILLTGGSGFLGGALANHLCELGHQVSLVIRPTSNLRRLNKSATNFFNIGCCTTDAEVDAFIARVNPEVLIHTACAYGRQDEVPSQIFDANLRFGLITLQALLRSGQPATFINTGTVLMSDVSLYALSKHQFAQWGRTLAQQSAGKVQFVNVLLQHMYGPGDDASKFTTHVLQTCHRNALSLDLTAGEQRRDFVYIDDVVAAYRVLAEQREQLEAVCNIEVGSGVAPSVREFVETVHRLTQSRTQLNFGRIPYRLNEAMHCQANIGSMKKLGWRPRFDLSTGLKKTIELEFHK